MYLVEHANPGGWDELVEATQEVGALRGDGSAEEEVGHEEDIATNIGFCDGQARASRHKLHSLRVTKAVHRCLWGEGLQVWR